MAADRDASLDIAVIGMAGRFPGARSVDRLWENLLQGREGVSFFADAELHASGVSPATAADPLYVRAGGVVEDVELFDAAFFGYSPREAALLDPQQRLFLETAWQALERAGHAPGTYRGTVGVYGGAGLSDYFHKHVLAGRAGGAEPQDIIATDKDFLATRVSYKLNLEGPSLAVQTACSTSLVAVHLACQALLAGECDMALAGGVTIRLPQKAGYLFQEEGIASPDGRCRAFSARAQGCMPGNGCAIVVLKRLDDALADRDWIHAVVKGSAINNDGAFKVGYTAPRVDGQAKVIEAALRVAGTPADTIGYLEAHGTGTIVGDPIEIEAATRAYRRQTQKNGYCAVGSIKSNIGHLDAAAGVAGFIKAVLAVEHGVLPPTLHCETTNPAIDFANSPFYVNTACRDWAPESGPRRAGVSSFGIGGTNAHVIVEEPPRAGAEPPARSAQLLLLSARSEAALAEASSSLASHLREGGGLDLADVAFTLRHGRSMFGRRRAIVCADADEAIERLRAPAPRHTADGPPRLMFMFPGQGSQYPGMARGLYEHEPEFRRHVDRAAEILRPLAGFDVREAIVAPEASEEAARLLRDTRVAQPAIFTVSYGLAQLFLGWGLRPAAMIGHSVGEYVAACLAGVFSLPDALRLVAERGHLMSSVAPGAMLAVPLPADELGPILPPGVELAAVNAPSVSVVSGPASAVEDFTRSLRARGIDGRPLHTSHAFHSAMMEPVLEAFAACVAGVTRSAPRVPYVSNVTGTWIAPDAPTDPAYWAAHLRGTVRFWDGMQAVLATRGAVLLEVGPGQTLTGLVRRYARDAGAAAFASTRHAEGSRPDDAVLLEALGGIWSCGVDVDWRRARPDARGRRVPLPTYPFQRERHWIERPAAETTAPPSRRAEIAGWFSVPTWQRMADPGGLAGVPVEPRRQWLVFLDGAGVGAALAQRLAGMGHSVVTVSEGDGFARVSEQAYRIDPASSSDFEALCDVLGVRGMGRLDVVHCWTSERDADVRRGRDRLDDHQTRGFYSLLYLAQALGSCAWVESCRLTVVSTNVHDVTGQEKLCPEKATVVGPCRAIPFEYPGFQSTHVDIRLEEDTAGVPVELVDGLMTTLAGAPEDLVAIRGRYRWRRVLSPLRLEARSGEPILKNRGVYLIAGGLGGAGLALAEHLAGTARARLVLLGRTGLPSRAEWDCPTLDDVQRARIAAVRRMERSGAEVEIVAADLSDSESARIAVRRAVDRFGAVNGIVHAAVLLDDGPMQTKSRRSAARVLGPKVAGTLALAEAAAGLDLDFFVSFSSLVSIVGGRGQVDYCAASAFQDAFAAGPPPALAKRVLSIGWAAWREVGVAARAAAARGVAPADAVPDGMAPAEALDAFVRALGAGHPHVLVSPRDPSAMVKTAASEAWAAERRTSGTSPSPGGVPMTTAGAPASDTERVIAAIWEEVLGVARIGPDDNFFDLGGDSVISLQFIARARKMGLKFTNRQVFEHQTVAALARALNGSAGPQAVGASKHTSDQDADASGLRP